MPVRLSIHVSTTTVWVYVPVYQSMCQPPLYDCMCQSIKMSTTTVDCMCQSINQCVNHYHMSVCASLSIHVSTTTVWVYVPVYQSMCQPPPYECMCQSINPCVNHHRMSVCGSPIVCSGFDCIPTFKAAYCQLKWSPCMLCRCVRCWLIYIVSVTSLLTNVRQYSIWNVIRIIRWDCSICVVV